MILALVISGALLVAAYGLGVWYERRDGPYGRIKAHRTTRFDSEYKWWEWW